MEMSACNASRALGLCFYNEGQARAQYLWPSMGCSYSVITVFIVTFYSWPVMSAFHLW